MTRARWVNRAAVAVAATAAVGLSSYGVYWHYRPVTFATATWCAFCLFALGCSRRIAVRAVWFNLAFCLAAVAVYGAVADGPFWHAVRRQSCKSDDHFGLDPVLRDDLLGFRPRPGIRFRCDLYWENEFIYLAHYSLNNDGLRVSPSEDGIKTDRCVLFFGGSFAFGEGVDDHEAMPYRVGVLSDGKYKVRNFAFEGYGPHQMLAQIEGGFVERTAKCTPAYAVYLAQPHHIARANGRWQQDEHGPRFVLGAGGAVARRGNFDDGALGKASADDRSLTPSSTVTADSTASSDEAIALFHGIVRRSRVLLQERYPGLQFHVVYWNDEPPPLFVDPAVVPLTHVHRLQAVLPDTRQWKQRYTFAHDGHPTALAHQKIAEYVVKQVLKIRPPD